MKITCQACHSKYNVADEKVQGKIVKIRCRKCGATIVVHGNSPAGPTLPSPSEAPPAGRITAPDQGQWHVSLSDSDQRQMTTAELVEAYQSGIATQETFVWTDGMADWKALAEVEAIVSALNLAAKGEGASVAASQPPPAVSAQADTPPVATAKDSPGVYRQPEPTAPVTYQQLETDSPVVHRQPEAVTPAAHRPPEAAAPFSREVGDAAESSLSASATAEPRRASLVKKENRGRDLFGGATESQSHPLDEPAPAPQYPAPYASSEVGKPTGQRNENSVLFSLAMLTKSGGERAPHPEPGATTTEDSGMIDLKALAERAASVRPAADGALRVPALSTKAEVYIPPLAVSPNFGSYMGAGPSKPPRSRTLAIVGGGVGVVALVVFGVFLGTQLGASTSAPTLASAAASSDTPDASDAATAVAPSASDSAGETAASAAPSASASAPTARGGGGWHPPPGGWPPRGGAAAGGGGGRPSGAAAGGGAAGAGGAASGGTAPPPPPKKTSDCGCNGDLMCLMKCSASGH